MKFVGHHLRYVGNRCLKLQLRGVTGRATLDHYPAGYLMEFLHIPCTFFYICQACLSNNSRNTEQNNIKFIGNHRRYVGNRCLELQLRGVTVRVIVDPDPDEYWMQFRQIHYTFFWFVRHFHQITRKILNRITWNLSDISVYMYGTDV